MNEQTLEALRASIEKWEALAQATTLPEAPTAGNCPLFHLFNDTAVNDDDCCRGCPVRERTGFEQCYKTPYYNAFYAFADWRAVVRDNPGDPTVRAEAFRYKAQLEVEFLRSLLPEATP